MNKTPPNLDLIYDKVLDFHEVQPDEYFDSVLYYLSDNPSRIHDIFDNLTSVFVHNPGLLNALKIVFFIVVRLGASAFFGLEGSRIPELSLDPTTQHAELLELKRILRYCLEKFQKMQTAHEIPIIGQKYAELCQITQEDVAIGEIQLTDFERQYSELAVKYQQFEQRLEAVISESEVNMDRIISENSKRVQLLQLLEQVDMVMFQPEQRFTKSENELILNFFHQKYALINRIYNEFPQIAQDYQKLRQEKKAKQQLEKGEEDHKPTQDSQIQNIKDYTSFIDGYSLAAFPESMSIEYKDYIYPFRNEELRKKLKATICAFLNTNGGRILIGVGNTGFRVKGLFLTTNDQDTLIRDIDALLKDFHPKVEPEEVSTTFVPIKKRDNNYKPGFFIVKIIVKRGKPNDLYFVGRDCYKRRNGQNDVQMPANFKRDIIDRTGITIQTHPELFRECGEFNDPTPERGIPVTNVKEKRLSEVKPVKPIGFKQKQGTQVTAATTKLLVKNLPIRPDIGIELKAILDPIQPLSKTLLFTKDNEVVLTFQKIEDTRIFVDYVEGNPIVIGNNVLQFSPKPLDKEKPEKTKMKVEVEEEKKDPTRGKAESSSSIIWVRNIPENTIELKEKLTAMIGEYAPILKDIKIHNKKKRASLEFESSIQANEVLNYLNLTDRFIGDAKVTFEKASPPSSPSQATKTIDTNPKAKEIAKVTEAGKPKEGVKKAEGTKPGEAEAAQVVETNVLKISNVPLDESGQELGYLIRACGHHIKKAIEKKINKDFVLFHFKEKEDAVKAYSFLTQNNFSFKGKKLKVDYYNPQQKTEQAKPKAAKSQTNNVQAAAGALPVLQGQGQPVDTTNQYTLPPGIYDAVPQQEVHSYEQHQQQFNPFMVQGNGYQHADQQFFQDHSVSHFNNSPFDQNYQHQAGFGPIGNGSRMQQPGDIVDQLLRTTETIQPDSIQFDIQNTPSSQGTHQQIQPQHQYLPSSSQPQGVFDPKLTQQQQQNAGEPQSSIMQTQPSTNLGSVIKNPMVQDQKNVNQVNPQKIEASQQGFQPIENPNQTQNREVNPMMSQQGYNPFGPSPFNQSNVLPQTQQTQQNFVQDQKNVNQMNAQKVEAPHQGFQPIENQNQNREVNPMMNQQGFNPGPQGSQQFGQNQFNQPQNNFVQDPKLLNQQNNAFQFGQGPQTGGPQQSAPQTTNQMMGGNQGSANAPGQSGINNQAYANQHLQPQQFSSFPQNLINPQLGVIPGIPGQFPINNTQQGQNKNVQRPQYQQGANPMQNNNFQSNWQQNQPQGSGQQPQFPGYPGQQQQPQFNQGQGQQQFGQQNLGNQFPQMNPQGQFGGQQGQYPMQSGGQFGGQPTGQYPFQGGFANGGKVNQMDQTNQTISQPNVNIQANKNLANQDGKQLSQNPLQGQGQMQPQGQFPGMGAPQNFGGPSYYSGYPQSHLPGNVPYGQQLGYNQNPNMQNLRPDMMYQNPQGNMQGNLQQGGNQGLTPQQLQQLQMQPQMQYGGLQSPQFVGAPNQVNMK